MRFASPTAVPMFLTLVAGLLLGASPGGCSRSKRGDSQAVRAKATWEYWQRERQINQELSKLPWPETSQNLAEASRAFETRADAYQKAAEEIAKIPVLNVDEDLLRFGTRDIETVGKAYLVYSEIAAWASEAQTAQEDQESFAAMAEAFIRGFCGDPLGAYNDASAETKRLADRQRELSSRLDTLFEEHNALLTELHSLRAELSRRYNREFSIQPE